MSRTGENIFLPLIFFYFANFMFLGRHHHVPSRPDFALQQFYTNYSPTTEPVARLFAEHRTRIIDISTVYIIAILYTMNVCVCVN